MKYPQNATPTAQCYPLPRSSFRIWYDDPSRRRREVSRTLRVAPLYYSAGGSSALQYRGDLTGIAWYPKVLPPVAKQTRIRNLSSFVMLGKLAKHGGSSWLCRPGMGHAEVNCTQRLEQQSDSWSNYT
ncbi:hypothetical protein DPSP01_000756 [Paraphaeosphaeria sporulosa]